MLPAGRTRQQATAILCRFAEGDAVSRTTGVVHGELYGSATRTVPTGILPPFDGLVNSRYQELHDAFFEGHRRQEKSLSPAR